MGMLVDGTWFDDDPLPADRGGAFLRPDSSFRDRVSRDNDPRFKAERGRYQLVTAPSCPWAHRTVLMRALKGLDGAVPLLESDLPKGQGWAYSRGFDDLAPKNGVFHVHQVYTAARPDYTGRATVPVLWDRKTKTIVNNESSEIIRMLNSRPSTSIRSSSAITVACATSTRGAYCRWVPRSTSRGRTTVPGLLPGDRA
jgi:glutathionyl-hydroquinone reductase